MKKISLFTFAVKNLQRKTFRTGVLAVSVALVVCSIVFGLSFVLTVTSSIQRASQRLGADLLVIPTGASRFAEEVLLENESRSFYMDRRIMEQVRSVEGVGDITSQTYLTTIAGLCCDVPEAKVVTFDQDTDFILHPWLQKAVGHRLEKGEAIVGSESFLNIQLGLMEIDANLFGNRFRIIGNLERTGTGLDNAIFIADDSLPDIIRNGKVQLQPDQISVIFVKVRQGYDPYAVGRAIEGENVQIDVVARKDIGKNIIAALKDVRQMFSVMVVLASLLSVFLAWSVFSAIANERAREIGIMKALGAKGSHIVRIFLFEVFMVSFAGSLVGIASGSALSTLLEKSFTMLKSLSTELYAIDRIFIAAAGLCAGSAVCVLGALLPVLRIKRMEPLMAIKEG